MAIYLKDLIENPSLLEPPQQQQVRCHRCNTVLQETITGKKFTEDGPECADCYYDEIGEAIEKHPIISGGNRRG